jgi:predicted anti-sigma-YlaC factor YlaD
MHTDRDGHPDDIDLDAARIEQASADVSRHIADCPDCSSHVELLTELAAELSAPPPASTIPAAREADILALIDANARRISNRRRWLLAGSTSALVAAAAILFLLLRPANSITPTGESFSSTDINRDHQVDILDAFALARIVEAGLPTASEWDFNADNSVDRADVDWVALQAVTLAEAL